MVQLREVKGPRRHGRACYAGSTVAPLFGCSSKHNDAGNCFHCCPLAGTGRRIEEVGDQERREPQERDRDRRTAVLAERSPWDRFAHGRTSGNAFTIWR